MKLSHRFIILDIILLIAIGANYSIRTNQKIKLNPVDIIPREVGDWKGSDNQIGDWLRQALAADFELWRTYTNHKGDKVDLWVAFYTNQLKSTAHNPNTCFSGQGWVTSRNEEKIGLGGNRELKVMKMKATKGIDKLIVFYWYYLAGTNVASHFDANLQKFYHGLLKGRTDLLYIRVMTTVPDNSYVTAENTLKSFIRLFCTKFDDPIASEALS